MVFLVSALFARATPRTKICHEHACVFVIFYTYALCVYLFDMPARPGGHNKLRACEPRKSCARSAWGNTHTRARAKSGTLKVSAFTHVSVLPWEQMRNIYIVPHNMSTSYLSALYRSLYIYIYLSLSGDQSGKLLKHILQKYPRHPFAIRGHSICAQIACLPKASDNRILGRISAVSRMGEPAYKKHCDCLDIVMSHTDLATVNRFATLHPHPLPLPAHRTPRIPKSLGMLAR